MSERHETATERIDRWMSEARKRQEIRCPKCNYLFEWDDMEGHVTYHGEDGPKDDECPNCEVALTIEEQVTREYEVTLTGEQADE